MSDSVQGFKSVLVAADFSAFGGHALQRAAQLSRLYDADLTAAHVVSDISGTMARMTPADRSELVRGDIEKFTQAMHRESDQQLAELIAPLQGELRVHTVTRTGAPYLQLVHAVQKANHDLVVVGTRGRWLLARLFLGSTAKRLVHHCPTPVWVVKSAPAESLKKILVAVDFSDTSAHALEVAANLVQRSNAELMVLHVVDGMNQLEETGFWTSVPSLSKRNVTQQARKQLKELIKEHASQLANVQTRVAWGETATVIGNIARRWQADVTVLGSVGRSGVAGVLLGNTAERVLQTVKQDVLVVKPKDFQTTILPELIV